MNTGIRPLTEEEKTKNDPYRVGNVLTLTLDGVPEAYKGVTVPEGWILNQAVIDPFDDRCGGFSSGLDIALREGKQMDMNFHWMMAREIEPMKREEFGVSNAYIEKALRKVGVLLKVDSPYDDKTSRDIVASPASWKITDLQKKAAEQLSGSTVWIKAENGLDAFDVYRAAAWKFGNIYRKPHCAVFGLMYNYGYQADIKEVSEVGTPHDVCLLPWWEKDYIYMANSLGTACGINGIQRVHRSVVNKWAEPFGAFIPIDASREQIDYVIQNGGGLDKPWLYNIIMSLLTTLKSLINARAT